MPFLIAVFLPPECQFYASADRRNVEFQVGCMLDNPATKKTDIITNTWHLAKPGTTKTAQVTQQTQLAGEM